MKKVSKLRIFALGSPATQSHWNRALQLERNFRTLPHVWIRYRLRASCRLQHRGGIFTKNACSLPRLQRVSSKRSGDMQTLSLQAYPAVIGTHRYMDNSAPPTLKASTNRFNWAFNLDAFSVRSLWRSQAGAS